MVNFNTKKNKTAYPQKKYKTINGCKKTYTNQSLKTV